MRYFFLICFLFYFKILEAQTPDIDKYRIEANKYLELKNNNKVAFYLNKIAFTYWDSNNKDSAVFYFLQGAKYNELVNNKVGVKSAYSNIAMIYADAGNLNMAVDFAKKSLVIRRQIGKKVDISSGLIDIATYLESQKKYSESNSFLDEAIELAAELNDLSLLRNCFGLYASNYKALGQMEKSQEAFNKYAALNKKIQDDDYSNKERQNQQRLKTTLSKADSLIEAKQRELLQKTDLLSSTKDSLSLAEKESKKKSEEIETLTKDQILTDAILKKKEAELAKSAIIRNFTIVGLFVVLAFVSFILYNMNKLKKAKNVLAIQNVAIAARNKEIREQKNDIERKSAELELAIEQIKQQTIKITDSISYAQRIQKAMLRSEEALQVYLKESFILLRPREKVSGDFFWFKEIGSMSKITKFLLESIGEKPEENDLKNRKLILAAIDCTGHGVPGAFMSLIGFNLLNEITSMGVAKSAANILNHLHGSVRNALRQDTTDNRDGMDVALCVIDKQKSIVDFSGAKNPLVYIQNGELIEIKGDKNPVGGLQREEERKFTSHKITVDKPTTFYIFSDGYVDQFGGEKNRKFMKKNFFELLLKIYDLPMPQQKEILLKTYKDWMGDKNSQIDDVLVIGFKLEPNGFA